jgi:hypothetical protein
MRRLFLALFVLLGCQTFAFAQSTLTQSLWKNQRGSTLEVTWVTPSAFGGTFTNHAAGYQCQGIPYLALGTISGDDVSFKVVFVQCSSATTWTGKIWGGVMKTKWNLLYFPTGQTQQGIDVFRRVR